MNKLTVWLLLEFMLISAFGQNTKGVAPKEGVKPVILGKTWAVVVGISDYQNNEIPDLAYAHVDASAFINYLKSPAGGNLDESHINGLINEKATAAQFASALDWLIDKAKEGDQVIIYFSGHGDVERKTVTQPGFLLCWDAPSKVYMGGGTFGLAYLQEVVSTLSLQSKAKVLVITDACHSGRLAGSDIGGTQATASNLAKQYANEVKLMSCQADELSLEGQQWGGGRGVFSYYLIKGLSGLADYNKDNVVTLYEIERFLGDKVTAAVAPKSQIPAVFGSKNTTISVVDQSTLSEIQNSEDPSLSTTSKEKPNSSNTSSVSVFEKYSLFKNAIKDKHLLYPEENSAWNLFNELKLNSMMSSEIAGMKSELAAALQDEAQQAINNYLNADPKELENRWKYDTKYEKYPVYLQKAAELLGSDHYLYKAIKAREHYYSGLNIRLKGEQTRDTNLFRSSMNELLKSLEYESNSSYALNELGYLNKKIKDYSKAIEYFKNAILQSPKWLLPRINLMNTYHRTGERDKALQCGKEILADFPNSYLLHLNLGVVYSDIKEWTLAGEEYNKALNIQKDDRDALYNLSFVLYNENKYDEVESIINTLIRLYPDDKELCIPMACIKLKKGQESEAFNIIEKALQNGFKNFEALENETDLQSIIKSERYQSIKKKYSLN